MPESTQHRLKPSSKHIWWHSPCGDTLVDSGWPCTNSEEGGTWCIEECALKGTHNVMANSNFKESPVIAQFSPQDGESGVLCVDGALAQRMDAAACRAACGSQSLF